MRFSYRPTARIVVAAVCVLAGIVVLWRTFAPAPASPGQPTPPMSLLTPAGVAPVVPTANTSLQATPYPPAFTATPALQTGLPPAPSATPSVQARDTQPTASVAPANTEAPTPVLPAAADATVPPTVTPFVVAQQPTPPPAATIAVPTSAPAATATFAPQPSSVPTNTSVPSATLAPTATPQPSSAPTNTSVPATATQPVASPTPSEVVVLYKVEGNAAQVVITYIDQFGKDQVLRDVSLPWELSFTVGPSADLAIDAFSDGETDGTLRCSISTNAVVVKLNQTERSTVGVTCEQFAQ